MSYRFNGRRADLINPYFELLRLVESMYNRAVLRGDTESAIHLNARRNLYKEQFEFWEQAADQMLRLTAGVKK